MSIQVNDALPPVWLGANLSRLNAAARMAMLRFLDQPDQEE